MIKRVLTILSLLLINCIILGHAIISHHHRNHYYETLAIEGVLYEAHDSEHFHHDDNESSLEEEHNIPEHCHLFINHEFYSTYISQLNLVKRLKPSINYLSIGFEDVELNKLPDSNHVNCELSFLAESLCKLGIQALRGPPVV